MLGHRGSSSKADRSANDSSLFEAAEANSQIRVGFAILPLTQAMSLMGEA